MADRNAWTTHDENHDNGSLNATLSRDPGSIESRLEKVFGNEKIAQRVLDIYFKKYGHNSIGDMGTVMFSVEGLSMMGAVRLVEHRLFNGQEASTRYLDFGKMGYLPINPEIDEYSKKAFEKYRYILDFLKNKFIQEGVEEKVAEPKAFDIAGAFLPISARTNVYWYGSIRSTIEKIRELRSGNDEEKEIGLAMSEVFQKVCPNSMRDTGEDYLSVTKKLSKDIKSKIEIGYNFNAFDKNNFISSENDNLRNLLSIDSDLNELPNELGCFGNITVGFNFDFRSSRDIHRHRAFNSNTFLSLKPQGVEEFYIQKLPEEMRDEILNYFEKSIKELKDIQEGFYGMPMAVKFPYFMTGDLRAWLYFLKLRSGSTVHPTVVKLVREIGKNFEEELKLKNIYQRAEINYQKRSDDENKVK